MSKEPCLCENWIALQPISPVATIWLDNCRGSNPFKYSNSQIMFVVLPWVVPFSVSSTCLVLILLDCYKRLFFSEHVIFFSKMKNKSRKATVVIWRQIFMADGLNVERRDREMRSEPVGMYACHHVVTSGDWQTIIHNIITSHQNLRSAQEDTNRTKN